MAALPIAAQTQAPGAPAAAMRPWSQKTLNFSGGKAVIGLPPSNGYVARPYCSSDGMVFVNLYPEGVPPELYSIASSGEVKHLLRTMPKDYTSIFVDDFYAADDALVTLFETEKRDDPDDENSRLERTYFLSLSDHDGDGAKLLALDLKFKPLKIALLHSGDFIVLGWDEINLTPQLVLLKQDGTLRRFIDLDSRKYAKGEEAHKAYTSEKEAASSSSTRGVLRSLQAAVLVPYGNQVLLTQPGSALPVQVLSDLGEERSVPLHLPAGFLLHDVLVSDGRGSWVVRAQAVEDFQESDKGRKTSNPKQRLFEVSSHDGSLIRELLFDKPHISAVTCAPNYKLTAIFYDTIPGASCTDTDAGDKTVKSGEPAMQLVISTIPR